MHLGSTFAVGLLALMAGGEPEAPLAWSPDGAWVAYAVGLRPADRVLPPGEWLLAPGGAEFRGRAVRGRAVTGYRIWATQAETGESVLLEESAGPVTAPGLEPRWFGPGVWKAGRRRQGRARFEIVIQDGPRASAGDSELAGWSERPSTRSLPSGFARPMRAVYRGLPWPGARMAGCWSFPSSKPRGLAVLRADNGRVLKTLEGACLPAWSPDGTKLAFFRTERSAGRCTAWIPACGPPSRWRSWAVQPLSRHSGRAIAAPWSRCAAMVVRRSIREARRAGRAGAGAGGHGPHRRCCLPSPTSPMAGRAALLSISFGFDREGEDLFYSAAFEGESPCITWFRPRDGSTYRKFNPFNPAVSAGTDCGLPDREVPGDSRGRRRTCRPRSHFAIRRPRSWCRLCPTTRRGWNGWRWWFRPCEEVLSTRFPGAAGSDQSQERATLLPVPGVICCPGRERDPVAQARQDRASGLRAALPAPGPASAALEAADRRGPIDLRLFARRLPRSARRPRSGRACAHEEPDRRLRLLGLRTQIYLGLGDAERADATASYLKTVQAGQVQRFEMTAAGAGPDNEPAPDGHWADLLALKADSLAAPQSQPPGSTDEEPTGRLNLESPVQGLGFDLAGASASKTSCPTCPPCPGWKWCPRSAPGQRSRAASRSGSPPPQPARSREAPLFPRFPPKAQPGQRRPRPRQPPCPARPPRHRSQINRKSQQHSFS